jgi:hypothetical protein
MLDWIKARSTEGSTWQGVSAFAVMAGIAPVVAAAGVTLVQALAATAVAAIAFIKVVKPDAK